MRCGAPAVTPSGSAQAGNARPRFHHCHITALTNYQIEKGSFWEPFSVSHIVLFVRLMILGSSSG
jgi:hypothetical protein